MVGERCSEFQRSTSRVLTVTASLPMLWAVHTYSTLNLPPVHELIEVESHRVVRLLDDNQEIRDRMKDSDLSAGRVPEAGHRQRIVFDAWMLKPPEFDASKKYPLFIYVYGEPHAQTVLDEWGTVQIDFHRVVAEMGYVVVSIDNRGTPAPKGAAWRRAIFGSLDHFRLKNRKPVCRLWRNSARLSI